MPFFYCAKWSFTSPHRRSLISSIKSIYTHKRKKNTTQGGVFWCVWRGFGIEPKRRHIAVPRANPGFSPIHTNAKKTPHKAVFFWCVWRGSNPQHRRRRPKFYPVRLQAHEYSFYGCILVGYIVAFFCGFGKCFLCPFPKLCSVELPNA